MPARSTPLPRSIAFVSGSKETDGIFRGNFQVFEGARDLGLEVRWVQCIDPGDAEGAYTRGDSVRGWRIPFSPAELGVNRMWVFPSRLRSLAEDRIFLGDPTFLNYAQGPRGARTIVHVHDVRPLTPHGDRWDTRWMFRYALPRLKRVRRIMVHTEFVRRALADFPGLEEKTYVLPPHTSEDGNLALNHLRTSADRLNREEEVGVLYVATDRPYKNLSFFFRLAKALAGETHPRFQFTLVSRIGRHSEALLQRLRPPNLAILPFAPDVGPVYWHSDVLAFPSLYEGFGLPMLEALSFGMPVIANDLEPMREVLGDGGSFAPPNDVNAWKEVLQSLADPNRYRLAGTRAAERSHAYSRDRFLAKLPALLE